MISHRDEEPDTAPDERAPLLGREDVRRDTDTPDEESESSIEPLKASSRTWEYVWKGCLLVLSILIIALFVKGWIEADDVDVSDLGLQIHLMRS